MRTRRRQQPFSLFSFQDIITSVTGIIILVTLVLTLDLITRRQNATPHSTSVPNATEVAQNIARLKQEVDEARQRNSKNQSELREAAMQSEAQLENAVAETQNRVDALTKELVDLEKDRLDADSQVKKAEARQQSHSDEREQLEQLKSQISNTLEELAKVQRENWVVYNPSGQFSKTAWLVDLRGDKVVVSTTGQGSEPVEFHSNFRSSAASRFLTWTNSHDPHAEYFVLLVRPSSVELYDEVQEHLKSKGYDLGVDLLGESETVATSATEVIPE